MRLDIIIKYLVISICTLKGKKTCFGLFNIHINLSKYKTFCNVILSDNKVYSTTDGGMWPFFSLEAIE